MKWKSLFRQLPVTRYTTGALLRWLWQVGNGNRLQALLNAAISVSMVVVSLLQVWAVKRAIDIAAGGATGDVYGAVALMGGLIVADFALSIASAWVRNILGIRAQNRMQQQLLDRLLRTEWDGRGRHHTGDIINRLEKDVNEVVNFLTETLPSTLGALCLFVGAFAYLYTLDAVLAWIIVVMLPVFVVLSKLYVKRMRGLNRQVRDFDSKVQSVLQETVLHRTLVKTLECSEAMVGKLENTQQTLRKHVVERTRFSVFSNFVLNFGFAGGYLLAFLWAAVRLSAHTLTFGGMTAFLQLVNRIQSPARSLTRLVPSFVSVFTAAERLMELEEEPLETQGEAIRLATPCGVRCEGVSYAYEGKERQVLRQLDFDFTPGSCTAILGETGAGKTTLVRLILALIKPQEGQLTVYDAHSAHRLSPLTRCNFVYVPQGNTLMSGTIRENLAMANRMATEEEMKAALRKACAEFVFQLPQGLDTSCAELGGGLSEGQAQRIAIARALLRDRPVMLLDEATSALDADTEARLLRNMLSSHEKTILFITHRPAVIAYCDKVLKIGEE